MEEKLRACGDLPANLPLLTSTILFSEEVIVIIYVKEQKSYGLFKFLGDCLMTIFTGGLWLIWVFVREMRRR